MKRLALITASLAVLLAGCAQTYKGGANPARPQVTVTNGQIAVDQPVLVFGSDAPRPVAIVWTLADVKEGYRFARNGIVIEGRLTDQLVRSERGTSVVLDTKQEEIVKCAPLGDNGLAFTCVNLRLKPGVFKYTIHLVGPDGKEISLDPQAVNW